MLYDHASSLFVGINTANNRLAAQCIAQYLHDKVSDATVFVGPMGTTHSWRQHLPDASVYTAYDESVINTVMARQADRLNSEPPRDIPVPSQLVLFDHVECNHRSVVHEDMCRRLLLNGRNYHMSVMVLMQDAHSGLTRESRGMFDFIFLQKESDIVTRKKIWSLFGGYCAHFDQFDAIFQMCTVDHGTLVIGTRQCSCAIEDNLFWFKAADPILQ